MINQKNILITLSANKKLRINNNLKKLLLSVVEADQHKNFNIIGLVDRIFQDSSYHEINSKGVKIAALNATNIFLKLFAIRKILNANKIDIIHCGGFKDLVLFRISLLGYIKPVSLILTDRATERWETKTASLLSIITLLIIRPNLHILNLAHFHFIKKYKMIYKKVTLINNPIGLLRNNNTTPLKIENDHFNVCYIKSIRDDSGHDDIIRLAVAIKNKGLNILIHIIGDGVRCKDFKRKVVLNSLEKFIKTYGLVENIDAIETLSTMDLGITTSPLEMMPNFILESFGVGVPVVGYNTPGVQDIIVHNKNGYLIDLGDIPSFLLHIKKLANNRHKLSLFAEQSLLDVRKYSLLSVGNKTIEFYNEVTGDRC